MDNKLGELSKPVATFTESKPPNPLNAYQLTWHGPKNPEIPYHMYSQEYVSALLQRIAELEKKERHTERQDVIDGLAGAGEAWSDIEEYMVKWDEERRNG